ncbi:variable large family protein (plasmid) [Borrelia turicatae 91E135]|nr:variable large family protein [Borrelia turicatae 91E135]
MVNGSTVAASDAKKIVEVAAVSTVIKALDTLTIAIRKTIDIGLKEVKEVIKINTNDTPLASDNQPPEAKKN